MFNFSRAPGTKTSVGIQSDTLVAADNTLIILARKAAAGGTAAAGLPVVIENFGNPVKAATECETLFGANSEAGEMVVAAINGIKKSTLQNVMYPAIKVVPLANDATSANLGALLDNLLTVKMPFVASCFPASDAVAMAAIKAYLLTISGEARGRFGQFGSFGFMATDTAAGVAAPIGLVAASEKICIPWLKDSAVGKKNKLHAVCAAVTAVCAANGAPYMPLTDVVVGGILAPDSAADWHTPGDDGTEALGLANGLIPLMSNMDGSVSISRSITSYRPNPAIQEPAYFDIQEWQAIYMYRTNCYAVSEQPQYKIAKASVRTAKALMSAFIKVARDMQELNILQYVDQLAGEYTFKRSLMNRSAFEYETPINVTPIFANKGVGIIGTTKYDNQVI